MTRSDRERLADGLYGVATDFGAQVWSRAKLRKAKQCRVCGRRMLVGDRAYRPITNGQNRWHRMCLSCVETQ